MGALKTQVLENASTENASTMQTYIPTGELVYTDSGSTESARLKNRKLFKILFKLLYLRFPPLQIRTCVFRTCIFHRCIFVLTYCVLAYSILRYFRFPYLPFQSPQFNATRCQILRLKCTKFDFRWGSARDPVGAACSDPETS